ncbi:hypothetical protein [Pseudomonas sp. WS 5011]|uniref:hypothetical protein n=1 Tax=Pseudomonas sp. WS 5011 TaxID=2717477 RepID=UPI001475FA48|nr:hypothetical protein [Pseudomonas sp. WS 5011]NMY53088.1 hypothetical protein [Pseudomonas sp. WS 5011]
MSNKSEKKQFTEKQISAQELHIPKIASRAFRNAYQIAIASGATVLVVADGQLLKVSKTERVAIRSIEPYGTLKSGTHIKITKKTQLHAPKAETTI